MGLDSLPSTGTPDCQILPVQYPSPEFDTIVNDLWKRNSRWLGFMPTRGFQDRAQRETLLAALVEGQVVGYVLFDLPRDVVKIIHLCVDTSYRGRGIARSLINAVGREYQDRRGIQLACRQDYDANALWPQLGFVTLAERKGRSRAGTLLTVWFRNHGHHNLFTVLIDDTKDPSIVVAIDFNIVLDIVEEPHDRGLPSRHLLDDWITQLAEICITQETYQETGRLPTPERRHQVRSQLEQFRELSTSRDQRWQELVSEISVLVPRAQDSDHRHLADAIAGKSHYFATRDQELTNNYASLKERFGIRVVSPQYLIVALDKTRSEDRYMPEQLNATSVSIHRSIEDEPAFLRSFQNHARSELQSNLIGILRTAQSTPDLRQITIVRTENGNDIATAISHIANNILIVSVLRLAGEDRLYNTVGRQLCFLIKAYALDRGLLSIRVMDQYISSTLEESLYDEGYLRNGTKWTYTITTGVVPIHEVYDEDISESDIALHEHQSWPAKLLGGGLKTFVIPIRPPFAEQLFDTLSAERTLFGRSTELGISREHVYYRSWRAAQGLAAPARILWYVSGTTPYQSEGHIRAVSQLREIQIGQALTLYRRFARLGVYTDADVIKAASDDGRVMALRFIDTEVFDSPVSLTQACDMAASLDETFRAPQSPSPVTEAFFAAVYERGSRYAE
ncbi:MAG: GNAT family N-acetyltransferase [bacterium]|nr:GNAT family N-acetyltransferase [bacterium]